MDRQQYQWRRRAPFLRHVFIRAVAVPRKTTDHLFDPWFVKATRSGLDSASSEGLSTFIPSTCTESCLPVFWVCSRGSGLTLGSEEGWLFERTFVCNRPSLHWKGAQLCYWLGYSILSLRQSGQAKLNKRLDTLCTRKGWGLKYSFEDVRVFERVHIIPESFLAIQHLYDDAAWCSWCQVNKNDMLYIQQSWLVPIGGFGCRQSDTRPKVTHKQDTYLWQG